MPALAKISRPRPHHAVARERLYAVVEQALRFPVVWLAAPPGAGKTTLVATFLANRNLPVIWYQVDAGDADPAAFFYYLGMACSAARRRRSHPLPLLAPEHLSDLPGFARRFFRQMFTRLAPGTVVVFDNFQEASDSGLSAILRDACAETPQGMNVVVVSRTEPPPVFAETEARGRLGVIDWNELKLTLQETRAMSAARGVTEESVVRSLHEQADGWVAGITLMLERLTRAGIGGGLLPSHTHEAVFNYFASLIFEQASKATRDTLLRLAFLPRMTLGLAQELSGNADAGKLLETLHRKHLFTDRRPGPEPVYQFHALFQAFLRTKATELETRETLLERLRRTGMALAQTGEWDVAFDLLVEAHAWDAATSLVLLHAAELLSTGRWRTLAQWVGLLPPAHQHSEPWLEYWLACAQAQTSPPVATKTFERVQGRFCERGERTGRVLSLAGLLHACSIDHSDYRTMDQWLDVLAQELAERPPSLTAEEELTAWGALLSAAFFTRPWHDCIFPGLARIESLLEVAGETGIALNAAASALVVASRSGDMERADRFAPIVERLAGQDGRSPVERAWGLFQVAHQRFVKADYEASLDYFDRTWSLAESNGLQAMLTAALSFRFMVEFRLRDRATVDACMRRIRALPPPRHAFSQALRICYEARHAQIRNEPQAAADFAARAYSRILCTGAAFHEVCYGLICGEILLAAGRVREARPLIERSRALVERSQILSNFGASLALVEAWLAEREGRDLDSQRLLRDALEGSQIGHGWCQMRFVDTTCAHMLRVALERGVEPDVARRLIRLFRLKPQESDGEAWPWPLRLHTLGRFEVVADGHVLEFERKTPKKPLRLLTALVAFGPREVPEQQLVDVLWPDEEGDTAHNALTMTVLRLRRLLGENELIRQQGGKLSIDRQKCWVDAWAFEEHLARSQWERARTAELPLALEQILRLYNGDFAPDENGEPWTVPARERLRAKFIHALGVLGKDLEVLGKHDEAIAWYLKGLDADAVVEAFYQGLMRCYAALDRRTEAIATYRRLRQTLSVTLGLRPSACTEKLYQSLRA